LFPTYSSDHRSGDGLWLVFGQSSAASLRRLVVHHSGRRFFLVGQSLAICIVIAGRFLARRKRYPFVFVIACCECLFMPFGTVLGVFTIVLLSRESVKAAFNGAATGAAPAQ
jgi:hypothetical protein